MNGSVSPSKVIISIFIVLIVFAGIRLFMMKYGNSIFKTERVATYFKRTIIFIMIISVIALAGYITVLKFAFSGWSHEPIARGEEPIMTSLGDKFLVQYTTTNFPDYQTDISIVDTTTEKKLGSIHIENDYIKPNVAIQVNSPSVRAYQFAESLLVYKVNNSQFKGVTIGFIEDENPEGNPELIVISKDLVSKKEWKWIKACGGFLVKTGDNDIKRMLKRYANDQFTQEELELNKNSEVKKEDIIAFSKRVLEEK
jgi:hypothetical protein